MTNPDDICDDPSVVFEEACNLSAMNAGHILTALVRANQNREQRSSR